MRGFGVGGLSFPRCCDHTRFGRERARCRAGQPGYRGLHVAADDPAARPGTVQFLQRKPLLLGEAAGRGLAKIRVLGSPPVDPPRGPKRSQTNTIRIRRRKRPSYPHPPRQIPLQQAGGAKSECYNPRHDRPWWGRIKVLRWVHSRVLRPRVARAKGCAIGSPPSNTKLTHIRHPATATPPEWDRRRR